MRPLHAAATHPSAPLPLRTSPFAFFQGRKINVEIGRLPAELKFHFPAAGPGGSCRPIGLGAAATAQGGPGGGTKQGDSSTCPWSSGIHRDGSACFVHLAVEASTPGYGFPYWDCPSPPQLAPHRPGVVCTHLSGAGLGPRGQAPPVPGSQPALHSRRVSI